MPRPGAARLYQRAVLWERAGYDDDGNLLVGPPLEIECRWEDRSSQGTDKTGNLVNLNASVTSDEDIGYDSLLWLAPDTDPDPEASALDQWYEFGSAGGGFGGDSLGVYKVVSVGDVPDLRNRSTTKRYGLQWYRETKPVQG